MSDSDKRVCLVEMVGLPGVGKSWVCSGLSVFLGNKKHKIRFGLDGQAPLYRNILKYFGALIFLLKNTGTGVNVIRVCLSSATDNRRMIFRKLINLFSELNIASQNKQSRRRMFINEQGVLQGVWSLTICASDGDARKIVELVENWLPDIVVYVVTEQPEVHAERLKSRETRLSRFDGLSKEEIYLFQQRGKKRVDEIVADCQSVKRSCRQIVYLNSAPLAGDTDVNKSSGIGVPPPVSVRGPQQLAALLVDLN